jgi:AcrR family transcriptional regulator
MPKIVAKEIDWIKLGLQKFAEGGVDALVIEQLAMQLGSSKTSFYWYFKNRSSFVDKIADYWYQQATKSIIAHIEAHQTAAPEQQVKQLLSIMFSSNEGKDFVYHLRKLGAAEPPYGQMLHRIEQQRIAYMSSLLNRCGLSPKEADKTSELLYNYYLGWYERNKHRTLTSQEAEQQIALLIPFIGMKH